MDILMPLPGLILPAVVGVLIFVRMLVVEDISHIGITIYFCEINPLNPTHKKLRTT